MVGVAACSRLEEGMAAAAAAAAADRTDHSCSVEVGSRTKVAVVAVGGVEGTGCRGLTCLCGSTGDLGYDVLVECGGWLLEGKRRWRNS